MVCDHLQLVGACDICRTHHRAERGPTDAPAAPLLAPHDLIVPREHLGKTTYTTIRAGQPVPADVVEFVRSQKPRQRWVDQLGHSTRPIPSIT